MDNKIHLIRWEILCSNKKRGGLGMKNLSLINQALLGSGVTFCNGGEFLLERGHKTKVQS